MMEEEQSERKRRCVGLKVVFRGEFDSGRPEGETRGLEAMKEEEEEEGEE